MLMVSRFYEAFVYVFVGIKTLQAGSSCSDLLAAKDMGWAGYVSCLEWNGYEQLHTF